MMHLPFLFVAEYADGQKYYQTPYDTSSQNPTKSAFYDIRQCPIIPESHLVKFGLVRMRTSPILVVAVNLLTGLFTLNHTLIPLPSIAPRKREGMPLQLIYERRNELEITNGGSQSMNSVKTSFRIGWQCEDEWLALDLTAHPERITLHGSHQGRLQSQSQSHSFSPVLIG